MDKVRLKTLSMLTFSKGVRITLFVWQSNGKSFLKVEVKILDKGNFRSLAMLESFQSSFKWCKSVQFYGEKIMNQCIKIKNATVHFIP